jgi:hypothetical protein
MARTFVLRFDRSLDRLPSGKRLSDGVSAAVAIGDALWLAHDETVAIEGLRRVAGKPRYDGHRRFALRDFVSLPDTDDREGDLEGLAYDGQCLWVVGSHAAVRDGADGRTTRDALRSLARVRRAGNRCLIARIPLADGEPAVEMRVGDRMLRAARLGGGRKHDALTRALRDDALLAPFLGLPSKDNGFDIEGVAAAPGGRLFLGLRGPVIDGWACVLDVELRARPRRPRELALLRYRKHFLDLGGAGIRDLCLAGRDLLVLTGPPMRGKGKATVRVWKDALRARADSLVRRHRLATILTLPYREKKDHAEGMALLARRGARASLLILYDSASGRRRVAPAALTAELHAVTLR